MSSSTPMGPGDAKKMVRVAQLGALALGVSAAALWALGVPGLGSGTLPVPAAAGSESDAPPQGGAAPTRVAFTSELAVDVAKRLDEARIKAPTPEPTAKPPEPPAPVHETPTQEPTDWRYIGTIKEPGRTLAVVSIEGQGQVIVPEGRRVGKTELVEIRQDAITVREGEVEREIPRAERVSSVVGWLKLPTYQAPAGLGAVPAAAGVPGGQPGFSPEQIARMRERGIDPAQAQRMRELMREGRGRRGGPDGAGAPGGMRGGGRSDEVRRMQEMGEERN